MPLDLNESFNSANKKIKSFNTYKDSGNEFKKRIKGANSDVKDATNGTRVNISTILWANCINAYTVNFPLSSLSYFHVS